MVVWLHDLGTVVAKGMKKGLPTPDELSGMLNLGKAIGKYLAIMAKDTKGHGTDKDSKEKIRKLEDLFNQTMNHVKSLAQRLQQAQGAQKKNGEGAGPAAADAAKIEATKLMAQTKAQAQAPAQRTSKRRSRSNSPRNERINKLRLTSSGLAFAPDTS